MQDYKNRVEAILFTTGRFMDLEELSRLTGVASVGMLKEAIEDLKKDYEKSPGSLTLTEENSRYKLNIKKEYGYLTTKLLNDCELDKPTQETLAIIAYKNPMMQSDVIKIRGTKAYDHIKFLRENEFITAEKSGRTRLLKLAPKFFEYFDVVEESLKTQFHEIENKYAPEQQGTLETPTENQAPQEGNPATQLEDQAQAGDQAPQDTTIQPAAEKIDDKQEAEPEEVGPEDEELD